MPRPILYRTVLLGCLGLTCPAMAQDWAVDKQHSQVGIVGKTAKTAISGTVKNWDGKINFDPNHLDTSHVVINVDVGSIKTSDQKLDVILPGAEWLAAKTFPLATFESSTITHVGGNSYEADGVLTIRGIRQNVALPFTVDLNDQTAHAQGVLTLARTDFGIGGVVNDVTDYAVTIGVVFDLTATK